MQLIKYSRTLQTAIKWNRPNRCSEVISAERVRSSSQSCYARSRAEKNQKPISCVAQKDAVNSKAIFCVCGRVLGFTRLPVDREGSLTGRATSFWNFFEVYSTRNLPGCSLTIEPSISLQYRTANCQGFTDRRWMKSHDHGPGTVQSSFTGMKLIIFVTSRQSSSIESRWWWLSK